MNNFALPWTLERSSELRRRWLDGESAAEIARALGGGVTRSAVLGKAHRLGLSNTGRAEPSTPPQTGGRPRGNSPKKAPLVAAQRPPVEPRPAPAVPALTVVQRPAGLPIGAGCRWPMGDPRAADFRFCDDAPVQGRIYCGPHCRKAGQSDQPKVMTVMGRVARPYRLPRGAHV